MTDIVERLRERKDIGNALSLPPTDLEIEAADEIERLRKLVAATERDLEKALAALDHHLRMDR